MLWEELSVGSNAEFANSKESLEQEISNYKAKTFSIRNINSAYASERIQDKKRVPAAADKLSGEHKTRREIDVDVDVDVAD